MWLPESLRHGEEVMEDPDSLELTSFETFLQVSHFLADMSRLQVLFLICLPIHHELNLAL